jgi:hypothetical protein
MTAGAPREFSAAIPLLFQWLLAARARGGRRLARCLAASRPREPRCLAGCRPWCCRPSSSARIGALPLPSSLVIPPAETMGNCFKKSSAKSNLLDGPEAPPASEDLGAGVDALFADIGASVVKVVKTGPLEKLGGRDKTKWVAGQYELSNTGLSWDAGKKSLRYVPAARRLIPRAWCPTSCTAWCACLSVPVPFHQLDRPGIGRSKERGDWGLRAQHQSQG